jgi:hypothetical protein
MLVLATCLVDSRRTGDEGVGDFVGLATRGWALVVLVTRGGYHPGLYREVLYFSLVV